MKLLHLYVQLISRANNNNAESAKNSQSPKPDQSPKIKLKV